MKLLLKTLCFSIITIVLLVVAITLIGLILIMVLDDEIGEFYRMIRNY